jgi:hypothetical protein
MATTNGTAAMLKAASTGAPVLIACARNALSALDEALSRGRRIGILCSGRKGRPAWDDTLCAGLLVTCLTEHFPDVHLADSARLARLTWTESKDFVSSLMSADHAVFLDKIGFGGDVAFAGEINAAQVVPELHEIPEGDGMRVVLRPAVSNAPRFLEKRALPAPGGLAEKKPLPVVSSASWQNEGLFNRLPGAGLENVFFAGMKHKKQRRGKSFRN